MTWSGKRRLIIGLIVGALLVLVLGLILFSALYHAPSCVDHTQNQKEDGVDCGGPCASLCTALEEAPTVISTRAIQNGDSRTDVIALVENKNITAAAKAVPYTISLYGADQSLIQTVNGTVDLPANATVPVFVPGVFSGRQTVTAAFLTIDASVVQWYTYRETRTLPIYNNDATISNPNTAPRIDASISNTTAYPAEDVRVVAIILDANGATIGASSTIIPTIAAQGRAPATFTWNQPFAGTASAIQIVPLVTLP